MPNPSLKTLTAAVLLIAVAGCSKQAPETASAPASEPAAAPATPAASPHPTPSAAEAVVDLSGIEKAEGGRTIAEVFENNSELAGESVLFRGKVVKVNAGIMGRNWLHVRDGSGAEGSNDLTVTTTDAAPNVGDTVLVNGTVSVNKDFGMGYVYPVVIEDASVTVENSPAG
ncbi:MAG TPA: hypothetical protein VLT59_04570 [Steroidobacteraceae bacterium]|nr:hypothetical protein [Steroidobacteraceae bacterium]